MLSQPAFSETTLESWRLYGSFSAANRRRFGDKPVAIRSTDAL